MSWETGPVVAGWGQYIYICGPVVAGWGQYIYIDIRGVTVGSEESVPYLVVSVEVLTRWPCLVLHAMKMIVPPRALGRGQWRQRSSNCRVLRITIKPCRPACTGHSSRKYQPAVRRGRGGSLAPLTVQVSQTGYTNPPAHSPDALAVASVLPLIGMVHSQDASSKVSSKDSSMYVYSFSLSVLQRLRV
jgi:hypothetical protein